MNSAFSFGLNRLSDSGATFSLGARSTVIEYLRDFRFQGRSTALLSRLTRSRRRLLTNRSSVCIPAGGPGATRRRPTKEMESSNNRGGCAGPAGMATSMSCDPDAIRDPDRHLGMGGVSARDRIADL